MPKFVFAASTCVVAWKGSRVRLEHGAAWPASHPFVKARPEFFADEPTVVHGERPVEDTSATPGKKRSIS